jgi:hypothetical protein
VVREVRDDLRQLPVEDRLAEGQFLLLLVTLPEEERRRGVDHLEVLGGPVEPAQEGDAEPQRLPGRVQQLGDLLLGVRALLAHAVPLPATSPLVIDRSAGHLEKCRPALSMRSAVVRRLDEGQARPELPTVMEEKSCAGSSSPPS